MIHNISSRVFPQGVTSQFWSWGDYENGEKCQLELRLYKYDDYLNIIMIVFAHVKLHCILKQEMLLLLIYVCNTILKKKSKI